MARWATGSQERERSLGERKTGHSGGDGGGVGVTVGDADDDLGQKSLEFEAIETIERTGGEIAAASPPN